jgi:hypothetical protein
MGQTITRPDSPITETRYKATTHTRPRVIQSTTYEDESDADSLLYNRSSVEFQVISNSILGWNNGSTASISSKRYQCDYINIAHGVSADIPEPNAPVLKRLNGRKLVKFNSCSTLFVSTTPANSDLDNTLLWYAYLINRSLSALIHAYVFKNQDRQPDKRTGNILLEAIHPIAVLSVYLHKKSIRWCYTVPSEHEINKLLKSVFISANLTPPIAFISLVPSPY